LRKYRRNGSCYSTCKLGADHQFEAH
jgi:hypothetical protein